MTKLADLYDLESVNEAIAICESNRTPDDYLSGEPNRIARTNLWTELRDHLLAIKNAMESGE